MIDFRYHLVSLISVFLALAVGIVLGAGPLKEPITGTLQAEVDQLRTDRTQARDDLASADGQIATLESYLDAVAPQVESKVLDKRSIGIIVLAQSDSTVGDGLTERLKQAGASVGAHLRLGENWWSDSHSKTNNDLAAQLRSDDPDLSRGTTSATLANALIVALTDTDATGKASATATRLLADLADAGLISADAVRAPVDSLIVYVDHTLVPVSDTETAAPVDAKPISTLTVDLARASASYSDGVVVGGPASADVDPVAVIRLNTALAASISTIDNITSIMGQISAPRALALDIEGTAGHYGTAGSGSAAPAVDGLVPGFTPAPSPTPTPTVPPSSPAAVDPSGSSGEATGDSAGEQANVSGGDAASTPEGNG